MGEVSEKQKILETVINYYKFFSFPKGISKDTFIVLLKVLVQLPGEWEHSIKDVSELVKISQSTLRRYFNFFVQEELVQCNSHLAKAGPPINKYRLNLNREIIYSKINSHKK